MAFSFQQKKFCTRNLHKNMFLAGTYLLIKIAIKLKENMTILHQGIFEEGILGITVFQECREQYFSLEDNNIKL